MPFIDQHILDRLDRIIANTGGGAPVSSAERRLTYNVATIVETAGQLKIEDTANTTFYNMGTSVLFVLGNIQLTTGQGIAFPVNTQERDVTKYTYYFDNSGTNICLIVQRLYVV